MSRLLFFISTLSTIISGITCFGVNSINADALYEKQNGVKTGINKNDRVGSEGASYTTANFTQILNHFQPADRRTWEQRFYIDTTFYKKGGPYFLYIFGLGAASTSFLQNSQLKEYAQNFDAALIGLEHRFYGRSKPFHNRIDEDFQYLSVQQSLADIAYFIDTFRVTNDLPIETRWILFGSQYGGALAAWARLKYPHLVHGAVVSSASFKMERYYPEYLNDVKNYIHSQDADCGRRISLANRQFSEAIRSDDGRKNISNIFPLCSSMPDNPKNINLLRETVIEWIMSIVDYSYPFSFKKMCDIMKDENNTTALEQYAKLHRESLYASGYTCFKPDYSLIARYLRLFTDVKTELYQRCTQLGLLLTKNQATDMFGEFNHEETYEATLCTDVFGSTFDDAMGSYATKNLMLETGETKFKASNIILTYGEFENGLSSAIPVKLEFAAYEIITVKNSMLGVDFSKPRNRNALSADYNYKIVRLLQSILTP